MFTLAKISMHAAADGESNLYPGDQSTPLQKQ